MVPEGTMEGFNTESFQLRSSEICAIKASLLLDKNPETTSSFILGHCYKHLV